MKQNPCRYCALAREYKGRHFPSFFDVKCAECEYNKQHNLYLRSKRKYEAGEPIKNIDELLAQEWVIWRDKATHIEVIKNLQLRFILKSLENNWFLIAVRKNMEE